MNRNNSNTFMSLCILFYSLLFTSILLAICVTRVGPITFNISAFVFPLAYILHDIIAEVYKKGKASNLIGLSFTMIVLTSTILQIFGLLNDNAALWRVLVASYVSYYFTLGLNEIIMSKMHRTIKFRFMKALSITSISILIDSTIFIAIAFYNVFDIRTLLIMIAAQSVIRLVYELILYPITHRVINKIKAIENIDVFTKSKRLDNIN